MVHLIKHVRDVASPLSPSILRVRVVEASLSLCIIDSGSELCTIGIMKLVTGSLLGISLHSKPRTVPTRFSSLRAGWCVVGTTGRHRQHLHALGAGAVPPGAYCQTPQCHLAKRLRPLYCTVDRRRCRILEGTCLTEITALTA